MSFSIVELSLVFTEAEVVRVLGPVSENYSGRHFRPDKLLYDTILIPAILF